MIDTQTTVRDIAVRYPQTIGVFEQHGIDYCCGGGELLTAAAEKNGVALEQLLHQLEAAATQPLTSEEHVLGDWTGTGLGALADHIERTHHVTMRKLLPNTELLLHTVARVHGPHHGELLHPLVAIYRILKTDIEAHLSKEEQYLFPAIKQCEGRCQTGAAASTHEAELRMLIRETIAEHEVVGAALHEIRARTDGFTLPEDACLTFARLYQELAAIEHDLHRHVHLENNILLPQALTLTRCHETS